MLIVFNCIMNQVTGIAGPPVQTPLVYVACGHDEIGLFDVAGGRCHQVLRLSEHLEGGTAVPAALQAAPQPTASDRSAALDEHLRLQQLRNPVPGASGYVSYTTP